MLLALTIALPIYTLLSLVAFIFFAVDKRCARLNLRRVPERRLHALSLLGGFTGSLAAIFLLRHKNRKPKFLIITIARAAVHLALWIIAALL